MSSRGMLVYVKHDGSFHFRGYRIIWGSDSDLEFFRGYHNVRLVIILPLVYSRWS